MKTQLRHIIIFFGIALMVLGTGFVVCVQPAGADEISPSMDTDELALFDLINTARRDPLGTAESLGMDRDEILNNLPELNDILINGLPELVADDRLCQTAGAHTLEMLENNYYAYESIDGKIVEQRMTEAGYVPLTAGESLGLIFFSNFINSDQAVSQIFENMYKDELSPDWPGERRILNPLFTDLGVGIGGGLYQLNEVSGNVYLATCDFGATVETYEIELLALINQLRTTPAAVTQAFGVRVADIVELFPEYTEFFATGLPPLAFNSKLYAAADVQITDMLQYNYWGHVSPQGVTPVMRIREQGYDPLWAAETKSRLSTCFNVISPENTVPSIFKNMFFNAFKSLGFRDYSMLSEKAVEGGLRVVAAESKALSGICGDNVHITVGDFGASTDFAGPVLSGVVYADLNQNGLFDAGEGVSGVAVTIREPGVSGVSKTVFTNAAGGYTAFQEPGRYRVSVSDGTDEQVKWTTIESLNVWKPFQLTDGPDGPSI